MSGTVADWVQPFSQPGATPWAPPTDLTQFPRRFTPPIPSVATWLRPLSEPVWTLPALAPGQQQTLAFPTMKPVIRPPGTPANFYGRGSTFSVTAFWTSGGGDAWVSFTLQWRLLGAPVWNVVANILTTTYTVSGLLQNTNYQFEVKAVNSAGSSGFA